MFRVIRAQKFPPFGRLNINLPIVPDKPKELAEVHLFTGINGTGKTRILAILAAFLGEGFHLKKRLKSINRNEAITFGASHKKFNPDTTTTLDGMSQIEASEVHADIISNTSLTQWSLSVPAFAYSGVAYINDADISVLVPVGKPDRSKCLSFVRPADHSGHLLQAIANLKLQAAMDSMEGNTDQTAQSRAVRIMNSLELTISQVTGQKFKFFMSTYPNIKLSVKWNDDVLPFDCLPDGLRSMIGWLAHAVVMMDVLLQGKGDPMQTEAVFLLDEIECSLHPTWQRRILPAFQRLFPKSQIFVATHSPFMIASLNHGWIHQLTLNQDGTVKVEEPKAASAGDSYVSVVEDIMGLKEWFDPETENLLTDFRESRDKGFAGDAVAFTKARDLANTISKRSVELQYMMGREISQMERHGAGTPKPK